MRARKGGIGYDQSPLVPVGAQRTGIGIAGDRRVLHGYQRRLSVLPEQERQYRGNRAGDNPVKQRGVLPARKLALTGIVLATVLE